VNEARGAKDTLGILFWGVMHKRFGVITLWDICYDIKSWLSKYLVMSSYSTSSEVTYTPISSHGDPLAWDAPPSPDYVPCPEYPEYLAPADDEIVAEDQPYADYALPVALSPGYVADSDPKEDPKEDSQDGLVDYPADGGDDDDDDGSSNDDEEEKEASEEEEEHLALADSVIAPTVDSVPSSEETEPFEIDESAATPPSSSAGQEHLSRCLAAPALPSSPLPMVPHPYDSPNHVRAPPRFRASMGRLRASSPSTHHPLHPSPPLPPLPSSLYLPPPVPTSLPFPSPPLPPLPASLSIPPPVDHREDIPKVELPPRKRLCLTALTSGYEVGEISTAARPTGGHRVDYRFISTLDAETRRQRVEEVGYGIRDVWVDPTEVVKEMAPTTLEGVNARVTELCSGVLDSDIGRTYFTSTGTIVGSSRTDPGTQARDPTHADDPKGADSCA
ncbi:hypothetical protein Tco_0353346, partial [Tanacetum coccineum]